METKTYSLTLNRLSKVLERVAVLRTEANQKVNELMVPVVVAPKDADTALNRLRENNQALNENLQRTNDLIHLHTRLRALMMKENAKHGITDLLMHIEEVSQQSKFIDHLMSVMKGGSPRLHHMSISHKDMPRLDDAEPLLAELKENVDKVTIFLKDVASTPVENRELLSSVRNLVGSVTLTQLLISPLTKAEVKSLEETSKLLHRKINSLHDELSALNAVKVNVDLPVDVAADLGLPA